MINETKMEMYTELNELKEDTCIYIYIYIYINNQLKSERIQINI
jgi:hypothetical protein